MDTAPLLESALRPSPAMLSGALENMSSSSSTTSSSSFSATSDNFSSTSLHVPGSTRTQLTHRETGTSPPVASASAAWLEKTSSASSSKGANGYISQSQSSPPTPSFAAELTRAADSRAAASVPDSIAGTLDEQQPEFKDHHDSPLNDLLASSQLHHGHHYHRHDHAHHLSTNAPLYYDGRSSKTGGNITSLPHSSSSFSLTSSSSQQASPRKSGFFFFSDIFGSSRSQGSSSAQQHQQHQQHPSSTRLPSPSRGAFSSLLSSFAAAAATTSRSRGISSSILPLLLPQSEAPSLVSKPSPMTLSISSDPSANKSEVGKEPSAWKILSPQSALKRLRIWIVKQWTMIGLLLAVALARAWPDVGRTNGLLHPEYTVKIICVFALFFISGVSIRTNDLKSALANYRAHAMVQLFSFVVVPLFFYYFLIPVIALLVTLDHGAAHDGPKSASDGTVTAANGAIAQAVTGAIPVSASAEASLGIFGWLWQSVLSLRPHLSQELMDGLLVLACMPPPVSSAVVLARAVGGSEAVAVFNSTLGSFLGIVLTPILLTIFLGADVAIPAEKIVLSLAGTVILPLFLGQMMRFISEHTVQEWLAKYRLGDFSSGILMLIIYSAFCDTFSSGVHLDTMALCFMITIVVGCQLLFLLTSRWICVNVFRLSRADTVGAMFCASHKSLTLGFPLIKILFGSSPSVSIVAIPLIFFHPAQIMVGTAMIDGTTAWMLAEAGERASVSNTLMQHRYRRASHDQKKDATTD